jgi:HEAT repeat protein
MPKRLKIGGIVLLLVLIGLIVWKSNQVKEPRYKGKPLSFWLAGDGCTEEETKEAVDHLGTNCIPTLLRMLLAQDSKAKQKLFEIVSRQSFIHVGVADAEEKHYYAVQGFDLLKARAKGAVSVLLKLYEESSPEQQRSIMEALGAIGPSASEAIPTLLQAMTSSNEIVSQSAASTLVGSGFDPGLVVPGLAKALSNSNEMIRMSAAESISRFGSNAAPAVPALVVAARDTDRNVRMEAVSALGSVCSDPQLAVPALTKALKDTQYRTRAEAASALAKYGTNAVSAIPLLIELSAEDLVLDRISAINALGMIHSRPDIILPLLTNALTDHEESTRLAAAAALGNFGNEAKSAWPALIDLYRREQSQAAEDKRFSSYGTHEIGAALLKIDPTAAARSGVKTNPPPIPPEVD